MDEMNYEILSEYIASDREMNGSRRKLPPSRVVEQEFIADTGATVVCGGVEMMNRLGLKKKQLLPTYMTLVTAAKKSLTVLGTVPQS